MFADSATKKQFDKLYAGAQTLKETDQKIVQIFSIWFAS